MDVVVSFEGLLPLHFPTPSVYLYAPTPYSSLKGLVPCPSSPTKGRVPTRPLLH